MNLSPTTRLLMVATLTLLNACRKEASKPSAATAESAMVALTIKQKGGFAPKSTGRDIRLIFVYANRSKDAVLINARGILAGRESPPFLRDIWMSIKNQESGRTAKFECFIDATSLRPEDLRVLGPGETFQFERDLHCFRLEQGRSLVSANVDVPLTTSPPVGTKVMALPAASNEITVEIR